MKNSLMKRASKASVNLDCFKRDNKIEAAIKYPGTTYDPLSDPNLDIIVRALIEKESKNYKHSFELDENVITMELMP